jgi:hypothetical protein
MNLKSLPKDLIIAKELVYDAFGFNFSEPQKETESTEYKAYRFFLNEKNCCYREAKITPTKTGQFVTLWKRNASGIIAPFNFLDHIDFVIITVRKETFLGQFIFPKSVLFEKGIFSTEAKEGKRAIRVYPPWDETTNNQAQKTQKWQLNYFYEIQPNTDFTTFKNLLV